MSTLNKFLGIIPARYASTRFPGKPLADIKGKTMIQRVYGRAALALDDVVVATDDKRIFEHVKQFNGQVVMTSEKHQSGTDRCYEALNKYQEESGINFDVIINIQGDEPFIQKQQIELLKSCFNRDEVQIATLIKEIEDNNVIFDSNKPKVIVNTEGEAMYFSRSPIPYLRGVKEEEWHLKHKYYQHIGMYAYRADVLKRITSLEQGVLECSESLEQLRWLENSYTIQTAVTEYESYGIDTPEDLERALKMNVL